MPIYGLVASDGSSAGIQSGGTTTYQATNLVRLQPALPYPLLKGSVSWSESFDSNTSGSIEYEDIGEADIADLLGAYALESELSILGIPFIVTRVNHTERFTVYDGRDRISTFAVSITLEGKYREVSDAVQSAADRYGYVDYTTGQAMVLGGSGTLSSSLVSNTTGQISSQNQVYTTPGNSGKSYLNITSPTNQTTQVAQPQSSNVAWDFPIYEVIDEITREKSEITEGYNDSELTGPFSEQGDGTQDSEGSQTLKPPTVFLPKEPEIIRLEESSENLYFPPENTKKFRSTKDNCDESGEKKSYRITTTVDGKPLEEEIILTGFKYYETDFIDDQGEYKDGLDFTTLWGPIEYRRTQHIYKRIDSVSLTVQIVPPGGYGSLKFVIHPDYTEYAYVNATSGIVQMRSRAKYLTEIRATGWKDVRLLKESDEHSTFDGPDDPYYDFLIFKREPIFDRTVYLLKSARGIFGEKINPPFNVSFEDYESLDARIKSLVGQDAISANGKVAVITPDPNFVEPLYVAKEISASNCFIWAVDPEAEEADFEEAAIDQKPPPYFTAGEERRNEVTRTLIKDPKSSQKSNKSTSQMYSERVSEYSAQDADFENAIERISFRDVSGKPPEPNYMLQEIEAVETDPNNPNSTGGDSKEASSAKNNLKYYITTPDVSDKIKPGENSASSDAPTLGGALAQIQLQLRKAGMQNSTSSFTLAGFYPAMRCGQACTLEEDRFETEGTWRLTKIDWVLEYQGYNEELGMVVVTTPGTSITRGLDRPRPLNVISRPDPADSGSDNSPVAGSGDPEVVVGVNYTPGDIGPIMPELQTRRNF